MINWLLMVGTDGQPDTYTPAETPPGLYFFLGLMVGILLSMTAAIIIKMIYDSKNNNNSDQIDEKVNEKEEQ